jgi:plastocyanin
MHTRGFRPLLPAVLLLAACTGEEPADQASVTTTAAAPNTVHVTATDFAFQAPDTIPSGVTTFHLMNQGKEVHHVVILKLPLSDVQKIAGGPPPADLIALGGPNAAAPGGTAEATVDLAPGTYTLICVVPSPDGLPHIAKGMAREVVVTPGTSTAVMPAADLILKLVDYGFDITGPLTAGRHVVRIENSAAQMHELVFVKLEPGKTVQQAAAWFEKPEGPPPATLINGVSPMSSGMVNTTTVDLTPGEYGLICYVPDAKDGKPHIAHGMVKQITVN